MFRKLAVIVSAVILTACAGTSGSADKLEESFTCTAKIEGTDYSADLERVSGSGWSVTLTSPETVKGMKLCYMADGKCTLEFEGHTALYERSELPEGGVYDLFTSAADMCIEDKGIKTLRDGEDTVRTGKLRGIGFTARSKDGRLTELDFNGGYKLTVNE